MESHSIGTGMLFQSRTSRPLSVAEWEDRFGGLGFMQDEWWFRAGKALLGWARVAAAGLAARRRARTARPDGKAEWTAA